MNKGKIKAWISQHMDWAICIGVVLLVGIWALYQEVHWEAQVKCKAADCRNNRMLGHDYCRDHTCQHEDCYELCVDGRIYCEAHIHCKYENCWRTLREGEEDYCERHQKVINRRKEEARKKEEAERKAREEAKKKEEEELARRRREYAKISGQGAGGKYYASYDSGYDDVYDGDYDDRRYRRDSEYANGVDDAIDELGDDW